MANFYMQDINPALVGTHSNTENNGGHDIRLRLVQGAYGASQNEPFDVLPNYYSLPNTAATWQRTSASNMRYSGSIGYRSGTHGNNVSRTANGNFTFPWYAQNSRMDFMWKVGTEAGFDFFNFYMDGGLELHQSGVIDWTLYRKYLTPTTHNFIFNYTTDGSTSANGSFCAVDDVGVYWDVPARYVASGVWTSPVYSLAVGYVSSSQIYWGASVPGGTNLIVETNLSLNGGASWYGWKTAPNTGAIPDISPTMNLSNARVQVRSTLIGWNNGTADSYATPTLYDLTIDVRDVVDTTAPTAQSVAVSTPTPFLSDGVFSVYANGVTDNLSGVQQVQAAVWTAYNGQDELVWHNLTNIGNNNWSGTVSFNQHNNEIGVYAIHFYGWDVAGNSGFLGSQEVTVNAYDSQLISTTIPDTMVVGQIYDVAVTFKNTGIFTWSAANSYSMGAVNESDPFIVGGRIAIPNGVTVAQGQQITFNFTMTAPNGAGTYTTDWRMVRDGFYWFGQTLVKQVPVKALIIADLSSKINVMGLKLLPSKIIARQSNNSQVTGRIIARQNKTSHMSGSINVKQVSHLTGSLKARRTGYSDLSGKVFTIGVDKTSLNSSLQVRYPVDLQGSISVFPHNKMTGILDISHPERKLLTTDVVKDSYIRDMNPRLNYGGSNSLSIGYSGIRNEILRAVLGFDLSTLMTLPSGYLLEKAILRLQYPALTPTASLSVGTQGRDEVWDESGVTWKNQPAISFNDSNEPDVYTVNESSRYIDFDVTDRIQEYFTDKTNAIGFTVSALDETLDKTTQFYSKEYSNGIYAPKLVFTYYDDNVYNSGRSELDSTIRAVIRQSKNLTGSITVKGYNNQKDIPSSTYILPGGEGIFSQRQFSLVVSNPDKPARIKVRQSKKSDLHSLIIVRSEVILDFESAIAISRFELPSQVSISFTKDIPSKIGVPFNEEDMLYSFGVVSRPEITGRIKVNPYSILPSSIFIIIKKVALLPSSVAVTKPDLHGNVNVPYISDLASHIISRQNITIDLQGIVIVNKPDMPSNISVNPYLDKIGKVKIRRSVEEELSFVVSITRPDLPSTIYVRFTKDITSIVTVRRSVEEELSFAVSINRPDLPSTIYVRFTKDVTSSLQVRHDVLDNFESNLWVSRDFISASIQPRIYENFTSSVTIRRTVYDEIIANVHVLDRGDLFSTLNLIGAKMLPSKVQILSPFLASIIRVPFNDGRVLYASFNIRASASKQLNSRINVHETLNLPSKVTIRHDSKLDTASRIIARRAAITTLPALVDVWITSHITSKIIVRRTVQNNLNGSVRLPNISKISGRIRIKHRNDLGSKVFVFIPSKSDLVSKVYALELNALDISTTLGVAYGGKLTIPSRFAIAILNTMYGVLDVIEPTVLEHVINAEKDALIREGVPTLNYGSEESLAVGVTSESEIFRSLLGFNMTSSPVEKELISVTLRLPYSARNGNQDLSLHLNEGKWLENGVTWDNQPNISELIVSDYTINVANGYVEFDITELFGFDGYLDDKNLSFTLKSSDETIEKMSYYFAREMGGTDVPKIIVTYIDPKERISTDRSEMYGKVFVYHVGIHNLISKISVRKITTWNDKPSTLSILHKSNIQSKLVVSRPDKVAHFTVRVNKNYDIPSRLIMRKTVVDEKFRINLVVSRGDALSKLYVSYHKDLTSRIIARPRINDETYSWGIITKPDVPSTLTVKSTSDIVGTVNVIPHVWSDYNQRVSKVIIRRSVLLDKPSKVNVVYTSILHGSINVLRFKTLNSQIEVVYKSLLPGSVDVWIESSLPSSLAVKREEILSSIDVYNISELKAKVLIPYRMVSEKPSSLTVSRPELLSNAYLLYRDELPSQFIVQELNQYTRLSSLIISNPETSWSLYVSYWDDIRNQITIRAWKDEDLISMLVVSRDWADGAIEVTPASNLPSIIEVATIDEINGQIEILERANLSSSIFVTGASVLHGTIRVLSGWLASSIGVLGYGYLQLPSSLYARVKYISELLSSVDVYTWKQYPSKLTVRLTDSRDLPAKIIIRQSDKSVLNSSINAKQVSDLISYFYKRLSDKSDLVAAIRILSHNDLPSKLFAYYRGNYDLRSAIAITPQNQFIGIINVIPAGDSDLQGSVEVHHFLDVQGTIVVRRTSDNELSSALIVHEHYNIPSEIIVRLTVYDELDASITIRRKDCRTLDSMLIVRVWDESNLQGLIDVRQVSNLPSNVYVLHYSDITCSLEIITAYPYAYIM